MISVKGAVISLMDLNPSKGLESKVKEIIQTEPKIEGYLSLKLRKSGPFVLEANTGLKKFLSVDRAHEITDRLEGKISSMDSFTLHMEPYRGKQQRVAIPVVADRGLDSRIIEHLGV